MRETRAARQAASAVADRSARAWLCGCATGRRAAGELAPCGVTVDVIAPGPHGTNTAGGRICRPGPAAEVEALVPMGLVAGADAIRDAAPVLCAQLQASSPASFCGSMAARGHAEQAGDACRGEVMLTARVVSDIRAAMAACAAQAGRGVRLGTRPGPPTAGAG